MLRRFFSASERADMSRGLHRVAARGRLAAIGMGLLLASVLPFGVSVAQGQAKGEAGSAAFQPSLDAATCKDWSAALEGEHRQRQQPALLRQGNGRGNRLARGAVPERLSTTATWPPATASGLTG